MVEPVVRPAREVMALLALTLDSFCFGIHANLKCEPCGTVFIASLDNRLHYFG